MFKRMKTKWQAIRNIIKAESYISITETKIDCYAQHPLIISELGNNLRFTTPELYTYFVMGEEHDLSSLLN